jgi:hypothetical protein
MEVSADRSQRSIDGCALCALEEAVSGCHVTPEARLYILHVFETTGQCPSYLGMFGLPDSFCQYLYNVIRGATTNGLTKAA